MKKGLFPCQPPHPPRRCDVTSTNIILPFYCLRVSIVSVYYRYEVWQGSDCVCGTCVPLKQTRGPALICWVISSTAVSVGACGWGADERVDRSSSFFLWISHRSQFVFVQRLDNLTVFNQVLQFYTVKLKSYPDPLYSFLFYLLMFLLFLLKMFCSSFIIFFFLYFEYVHYFLFSHVICFNIYLYFSS